MTARYQIAPRFDPLQSLVGRLILRKHEDRLRGENTFYVVAVGITTVCLVLSFVAWGVLHPTATDSELISSIEWQFWLAQLLLIVVVAGSTWIGVRPRVSIDVSDAGIAVRKGRSAGARRRVSGVATDIIPADTITGVSRISTDDYYSHYRRYQRTRAYLGSPSGTLVLVTTAERPWVLGVRREEQNTLVAAIATLLPVEKHAVA